MIDEAMNSVYGNLGGNERFNPWQVLITFAFSLGSIFLGTKINTKTIEMDEVAAGLMSLDIDIIQWGIDKNFFDE